LPEPALSPERYALAVITDDDQLFPEVRKQLGAQFRTTLASTELENKIRPGNSPTSTPSSSNLDCIGDGPADGLDVLAEMPQDSRRRRHSSPSPRPTAAPFLSSQPGWRRRVFPLSSEFAELQIVLSRARKARPRT